MYEYMNKVNEDGRKITFFQKLILICSYSPLAVGLILALIAQLSFSPLIILLTSFIGIIVGFLPIFVSDYYRFSDNAFLRFHSKQIWYLFLLTIFFFISAIVLGFIIESIIHDRMVSMGIITLWFLIPSFMGLISSVSLLSNNTFRIPLISKFIKSIDPLTKISLLTKILGGSSTTNTHTSNVIENKNVLNESQKKFLRKWKKIEVVLAVLFLAKIFLTLKYPFFILFPVFPIWIIGRIFVFFKMKSLKETQMDIKPVYSIDLSSEAKDCFEGILIQTKKFLKFHKVIKSGSQKQLINFVVSKDKKTINFKQFQKVNYYWEEINPIILEDYGQNVEKWVLYKYVLEKHFFLSNKLNELMKNKLSFSKKDWGLITQFIKLIKLSNSKITDFLFILLSAHYIHLAKKENREILLKTVEGIPKILINFEDHQVDLDKQIKTYLNS